MATVSLRKSYKNDDIAHMLHGANVPSVFAKSGNKIFVEGYGVRLIDIDGKEYIDAMSSGFCGGLGYRNQEIIEAATTQMTKLHSCMSFAGRSSPPEIDLACKLVEVTPAGLERFMFTNSGSDANETAFKIVRWYWRERGLDKYKIISLENAYHGATYGAQSASSYPAFTHKYFEPQVPGFSHIPSVYCYRCPYGKSYPGCGIVCAQALDEAIVKEGKDKVGAFLAEPIETAAGMLVPPPEYWPRIMEICKKRDVLLIIDEVINGFGRTGKFWASEHWDIIPDIIVFSKGIAGGYMPIAGVGITEEIYESMIKNDKPFPHVFTYGGHPASCAVALKNIEIMLRDNLIEKAAETGIYLKQRLGRLQKQSPYVGDIRGLGLYFGIELVADKKTKKPFPPEKQVSVQIRTSLSDKGIIVGGFGPDNLSLGPPLVMTRKDLDYVLDGLEQVIMQM